jgi:hypothetical protein
MSNTDNIAHRFEGGCHCGNLSYVFETSTGFDKLGLRMCACDFCRKHGQRSASDPNGHVHITVKNSVHLTRYRFAHNTSDFLICTVCGVYIGAMLADKNDAWMVVNVNTLKEKPALDYPVTLHNFDSETYESRIDRRKKVWTPMTLTEGAA